MIQILKDHLCFSDVGKKAGRQGGKSARSRNRSQGVTPGLLT